MLYQILRISLFVTVFLFLGCVEKTKYENEGVQMNYLNSLSDEEICFLKNIIPISYAESEKIKALYLKNLYLKLGCQNIDLFAELRKATELGKPLLIYFTGHGCVNCRKMEEFVLNNKKVKSVLEKEFKFMSLCVDDRTKLPESYWQENPYQNENTINGRPLSTVGSINNYFQIALSRMGSNPVFIVIDENRILGDFSFTKNSNKFMEFLNASVENYKKK